MCTKEIHQKLIQEEDAVIFASFVPSRYKIQVGLRGIFAAILWDGYLVCKNYGQVHDEYFASE